MTKWDVEEESNNNNMDKLEQLKKRIEETQTKSLVAEDMKQFIKLVLEVVNKHKDEIHKLSAENLKVIRDSVAYIEEYHNEQLKVLRGEKDVMVGHFDTNIALLNGLIEKVKAIRGDKGEQGEKGESIKGEQGEKGKDGSPDTGEEIADKLEALEGDKRLDKSAIKGLEDLEKQVSSISSRPVISGGITQAKVLQLIEDNASGGHTIEDEGTPLTQRTKLNFVGSSVTVTDDAGDDATVVTISGGGTIDGSGTTNELTYWVDADTLGALAVATYPSLTELSYVKGVTSAIQTQINAKAPSTSPTFATSITGSYLTASEILITDGSKNIVSAPVATYPSLTELSYVKGVTSAIQTQLNGKAPSLGADDNYVTDAQLVVIGNTSGTNTGDQTSIVGITGTKAQFDTAVTDGNFLYVGDVTSFAWGATASGTTADGLTLTLSNSSDDAASALKLVAGNTQTSQPVLANLQLGTSGNVQGLMIQGTGGNTAGAVGTGLVHQTLWSDVNNSTRKVLSVAYGSTFTESLNIQASGQINLQAPNNGQTTYGHYMQTNTGNNSSYNIQLSMIGTAGGGGNSDTRGWDFTPTFGATATSSYFINAVTNQTFTSASNDSDFTYLEYNPKVATAVTRVQTGGVLHLKRAPVTSNASANLTVSGAVVHFEQTYTQTSGTLAISGDVLKLTQASDAGATGKLINALNATTPVFTVDKTGNVILGGTTSAPVLRLLEPSASGAHYTEFTVAAQAANITYTLPVTVGGAGTFLTDVAGDGVLSWATPAGSGDVTKVGTPVNNQVGVWTGDGTLEGDAALTFDTTSNTLATDIVTVLDEAYDEAGWNGDLSVPTKNAVRDKIESMGGGVTEAYVLAMSVAL